jgi:hypothetical protein
VSALHVVEAFDVIGHFALCSVACPICFATCVLCLSDEKKHSLAALSQTLPERLIEQTMP